MADHGLAGCLKWRCKTRLGGMGLWELMKVFQNRSGKEYGFSAGEVAPCVCALTVFHVLLLPSLTPPNPHATQVTMLVALAASSCGYSHTDPHGRSLAPTCHRHVHTCVPCPHTLAIHMYCSAYCVCPPGLPMPCAYHTAHSQCHIPTAHSQYSHMSRLTHLQLREQVLTVRAHMQTHILVYVGAPKHCVTHSLPEHTDYCMHVRHTLPGSSVPSCPSAGHLLSSSPLPSQASCSWLPLEAAGVGPALQAMTFLYIPLRALA